MISQSCNTCPSTKCIKTSTGGSSSNSGGGGGNAGAIAGGVIGGVAFIALLTFLVWWFFIRKKRQDTDQEMNEVQEKLSTRGEHARRSTAHSIASTTGTRASNVIQIAYIPGVTNRATAPGVPPVPPIPGAALEQHFFMPGDLRDSAWSTTTGEGTSAQSTRSSVATTMYRSNAVVDQTAQHAMRTRPAVVSIHNGANGPSTLSPAIRVTAPDVPAVPRITDEQRSRADAASIRADSVSAFSLRAPSISSIHSSSIAGNSIPLVARSVTAKPVTVTRSPSKEAKGAAKSESGSSRGKAEASESSGTPKTAAEGPFDDKSEIEDYDTARSFVLDQGSRPSTSGREGQGQESNKESPFSDTNEVK